MVIECLKKELQRVLGCSVEVPAQCLKRGMLWLGAYLLLMLVTSMAAVVVPAFFVLFGIELSIISTVFGFILFLAVIYYGIYFGRMAWLRAQQRPEPTKQIEVSEHIAD